MTHIDLRTLEDFGSRYCYIRYDANVNFNIQSKEASQLSQHLFQFFIRPGLDREYFVSLWYLTCMYTGIRQMLIMH